MSCSAAVVKNSVHIFSFCLPNRFSVVYYCCFRVGASVIASAWFKAIKKKAKSGI